MRHLRKPKCIESRFLIFIFYLRVYPWICISVFELILEFSNQILNFLISSFENVKKNNQLKKSATFVLFVIIIISIFPYSTMSHNCVYHRECEKNRRMWKVISGKDASITNLHCEYIVEHAIRKHCSAHFFPHFVFFSATRQGLDPDPTLSLLHNKCHHTF